MANYLAVEDLSNFLRSRKGACSKIAADWVDEHKEEIVSQIALDRFETLVIELSLVLNSLSLVRNALRDDPERAPFRYQACRSACLTLIAPRYIPPPENRGTWFPTVFGEARLRAKRLSPAWAASLARFIRERA